MSFRIIVCSFLFLLGFLVFIYWGSPLDKSQNTGLLAFYNVENLFDTIDDPHKNDNAYLPSSQLTWNTQKYQAKQNKIGEIIVLFDKEELSLLGLAEVENKRVLTDLLKTNARLDKHYSFIQEDSDDPRGIDVALVYAVQKFKPLFHKVLRPCNSKQECLQSRDVLVVKGVLHQDTVWVYVNHWPSRRGGVEASQGKRALLSEVLKRSVDSVRARSPHHKIILMGDFNDTPEDKSVLDLVKKAPFFNPFDEEKLKQQGSLKYKKKWFLYDQILLSEHWTSKDGNVLQYKDRSAVVFHPYFLHYKGIENNGPFRTYSGSKYYGGYSDHFPVYLKYSIKDNTIRKKSGE